MVIRSITLVNFTGTSEQVNKWTISFTFSRAWPVIISFVSHGTFLLDVFWRAERQRDHVININIVFTWSHACNWLHFTWERVSTLGDGGTVTVGGSQTEKGRDLRERRASVARPSLTCLVFRQVMDFQLPVPEALFNQESHPTVCAWT